MTQVFTTNGELIPVTVVEVKPNVVLQKKTNETDGYEAVQLGYEDVKEHRSNKPAIGHAKKANTAPKHYIREIKADEMMDLEVGAEVKADLFKAGDMVDVQGISKGHGYTFEKNTPMPGHDGVYTTTNQNLTVVKVDAEEGYILIKGNVPGPKKGLVMIKTTVKPVKETAAPELVSYAAAEEEGK